MDVVLNSLLYATVATMLSQVIAIGAMRWLGLSPTKLAHQIEDVQNVAVGAGFFVISLITSIFIAVLAAAPEEAESVLASWGWIFGGLALALLYTGFSFAVAHRMMARLEGENVYTWIRRELVDEQNASLAFFLGGLMSAAFFSVLGQII
ncbi:MAG: hypothetical protein L0154_05800 [Chloroflexi bacterium]|nr:hypothetical protein [Chloroflexota bacterium]